MVTSSHEGTHFINAAVLNEKLQLRLTNQFTIDWNPETNEIEFL
jgi:hypothetical protein